MAKEKTLRNKSILFNLITIILWVWALSYIFVIVWAFTSSCRDGIAFAINDKSFFGFTDKEMLPSLEKIWSFKNYGKAFTELQDEVTGTNFFGMFGNSVWITTGFIFFNMICRVTTAYALAFYVFKGRDAIYKFFILQMILPSFGSETSSYRLLSTMGLIDNPLFFISLICGHGMTMLIYHSTFVGFSKTYAEAARLDGAGEAQIFFQIYLPMAKSVIVALCVNDFVGLWQNYSGIMIYFPSYPTLATGLFAYSTRAVYVMDTPTYYAGLLIANLPIFILFAAFNKTMLQNITIGGLKG